MNFPELKISYNTSENDIDMEFYLPCLSWAKKFDRGVGYFTSGWISKNALGLAEFVSNGGHARWITSPILEEQDYEMFNSLMEIERSKFVDKICEQTIEKMRNEMKEDTRNALAWMIHDKVLEIRFAVPIYKLNGDFHTKFGLFYGPDDNIVAFEGSNNDSKKGFSNYESFVVFMSWKGMREYVEVEQKKFRKIWEGLDYNVKIYKMSQAIQEKIFTLRTGERPYKTKIIKADKWRHQEEAKQRFIEEKHGILAMATGTGKTFTSIKIIKQLFEEYEIDRVIIIVNGNDLLKQWYIEIIEQFENVRVFQMYDKYRQLPEFLMCKKQSILLISRRTELLLDCFKKLKRTDSTQLDRTLLIFDEVHGLGSEKMCSNLAGIIQEFKYRLGLSATPQRPFDEVGNDFIEQEIGKVIYEFTLEHAIKRGILCELNYIPLPYELTSEEKNEKRRIIASFEGKKKRGEKIDITELYRRLSLVNKLAEDKVTQFKEFITKHPELLERCLIFVESMDYGIKVQEILTVLSCAYHTYYADDDVSHLMKFSRGQIDCLITCKKISEGVDIKTVRNVILFSSERGRLVTTQRIGRSLRLNPEEPNKKANIVDFVCTNSGTGEDGEVAADNERKEWLEKLSKVRRNEE